MRWRFWKRSKPSPVEPPKEAALESVLKSFSEDFNVGLTKATVFFDDGRIVHIKVYGNTRRYCGSEIKIIVQTSVEYLNCIIRDMESGKVCRFADDSKNPTTYYWGKPVQLRIDSTEDYTVKGTVYRYVSPDKV